MVCHFEMSVSCCVLLVLLTTTELIMSISTILVEIRPTSGPVELSSCEDSTSLQLQPRSDLQETACLCPAINLESVRK